MEKKLKLWAVLMIAGFVFSLLSIIVWLIEGTGEANIFIITSGLSLVISGYVYTVGQKQGFYENQTN